MPAPSAQASMLSRVPARTSAMSCPSLISYCTHSARRASSSDLASCASSTRSARPLPSSLRLAVTCSIRWRRTGRPGKHPSGELSGNAPSPLTASFRTSVPETFIARHPSSSAICAISSRSVDLPEPRGPAGRMRRPGAPGPSHIPSKKSSVIDVLSICRTGRRQVPAVPVAAQTSSAMSALPSRVSAAKKSTGQLGQKERALQHSRLQGSGKTGEARASRGSPR